MLKLVVRLVERGAFDSNSVSSPAGAWDHAARQHYNSGGDRIELDNDALTLVCNVSR
jgi:hypothetical protein